MLTTVEAFKVYQHGEDSYYVDKDVIEADLVRFRDRFDKLEIYFLGVAESFFNVEPDLSGVYFHVKTLGFLTGFSRDFQKEL